MDANRNADTTDTTVPEEVPDSLSGTVVDAPRKINPVFYIALGVACLAIGQDFIEEGIRAAGGRIALGPIVAPSNARIDR